MYRKITCLLFSVLLTFAGYSRGHINLDSVFFNPSYFQLQLDSLYWGHFRQALKGYDQENNLMLATALPGLRALSETEISRQVGEMNSVINVGYNQKVKDFIDVLLFKRPEASCLLLTLADHYVPLFQSVFDKYHVPHELAYLPSVISAFNPGSSSVYGSSGIWNIMYISGKLYKLEINSMVDERRNYEKSTDAAARQFKDFYSIYQDWTLALTAFVAGPAVVNKAIRRANGKRDFWSLYPFLPAETRDYMPAYMAMTYFVNYHDALKLKPLQADLPFASDTVSITKELHLRQVSKVLDIPMDILRELNPQYKHDILPGSTKRCVLNLPISYGDKFRTLKDSIYNYKDSVVLATRQSATLFPGSYIVQNETHTGTQHKNTVYYTVKSGDNLGAIASKFHVTVTDLKTWNHLKSTSLRVGQQLIIYSAYRTNAQPAGHSPATKK
ncbi:MAG: LysM peptidoglycan-binding domain-containing protein [Bacteroidetes bacterium]|nr:LysM peptidoglycan-binding domain-containing protein [Bacteroidota bacterium]